MKRKLLLLWLVLLFVVSVCALTACQHEHVFTDWQTELVPTCTEEGIMFRTCDCGERETKSIPANGHLVGGWTTEEATCTQDGSRVQQCANCGEAVNTEIIPTTGHVENPNWIVDKEATCSEKGSRHTKCDNCGETIQTEEIEMVDHVYLFTRLHVRFLQLALNKGTMFSRALSVAMSKMALTWSPWATNGISARLRNTPLARKWAKKSSRAEYAT